MVTNGVHRVGGTVWLFRTHWKAPRRSIWNLCPVHRHAVGCCWCPAPILFMTGGPISCYTAAASLAKELPSASRHPLPPWGWLCSSGLMDTGPQKVSTCLKVGQCCGAAPEPQAPRGLRLKAAQLRPHLCLLPSPDLLPSSLSPQLPLPINHTYKNPCHRLCFWEVGLPRWLSGLKLCLQCRRHRRRGFEPWAGKIPLEEEMATHSSILAWEIPWTEEPGGLQSKGSQRFGHDWAQLGF